MRRAWSVLRGAAAESAGLRVGDVGTHHDGKTLERRGCITFGGYPDGAGAVLTVRRGATSLEIEVAAAVLVPWTAESGSAFGP